MKIGVPSNIVISNGIFQIKIILQTMKKKSLDLWVNIIFSLLNNINYYYHLIKKFFINNIYVYMYR